MNNFLEEKEKLLNSIENNTSNHWKEYYKNVPLDCIFDDLVIDVNEIKRLTKENKQLKGSLQTYEVLLKANVEENQQLKADYGNKAQVERDLLEEENKQLKEQLQQKEDIINKIEDYLIKNNLFSYKYDEEELYEIVTDDKARADLLEILNNRGE